MRACSPCAPPHSLRGGYKYNTISFERCARSGTHGLQGRIIGVNYNILYMIAAHVAQGPEPVEQPAASGSVAGVAVYILHSSVQ